MDIGPSLTPSMDDSSGPSGDHTSSQFRDLLFKNLVWVWEFVSIFSPGSEALIPFKKRTRKRSRVDKNTLQNISGCGRPTKLDQSLFNWFYVKIWCVRFFYSTHAVSSIGPFIPIFLTRILSIFLTYLYRYHPPIFLFSSVIDYSF